MTVTNLPAAVDGLREIVGRMTPRRWRFGRGHSGLSVAVLAGEKRQLATTSWHTCSEYYPTQAQACEDFVGIVALRNTALPIIDAQAARIAELEAEVARLREALARRDAVLGMAAYMGGNP